MQAINPLDFVAWDAGACQRFVGDIRVKTTLKIGR
jgi:hypothetical protein